MSNWLSKKDWRAFFMRKNGENRKTVKPSPKLGRRCQFSKNVMVRQKEKRGSRMTYELLVRINKNTLERS
jgi:hypothetical protein